MNVNIKNFFNFRRVTILIMGLLLIMFKCFSKYNTKNTEYQLSENKIYNSKLPCKVTKVIDGDTIEVIIDEKNKPANWNETERIRLIGINCPELNTNNNKPAEYYALEAYQYTEKELYNQYIFIQTDNVSNIRDNYGRILAYVWVEKYDFNKILLEKGYAKYYPNFKFNEKKMEEFKLAQEFSKSNKMGMWNE